MADGLVMGVEGRLGVIALDRPRAINALTRGMVLGIATQLGTWQNDDEVRAVLFEGRGARGFSAGGDVRQVRADVLAGRSEEGFAFFAEEYAMNALIAGYPKPVLSLAGGIVMGGGIGIAGHAAFRFSASDARYAMPEAAIGFVCDVGSNAILMKAPPQRALAFLMTGLTVGAADALALGLTDCAVPAERLADVRRTIAAAVGSGEPDSVIVAMMLTEGIEAGEPGLCLDADLLEKEFGLPSAAEVVAAVGARARLDARLRHIADALAARCPTSLEAILQSHRAARRLGDLTPVLALDLRLARLMAARNDFAEGVRAVLIDKEGAARWSGEVPRAAIAAEIAAVEAEWAALGQGLA